MTVKLEEIKAVKQADTTMEKALLPVAGAAAVGTGIGIGGIIALAYGAWKFVKGIGNIPENQIRSADTAMSQLRETVSLVPQGVAAGSDPLKAIYMINDIQAELERQHGIVKRNEQRDPGQLANPGAADAANLRYLKIKIALENAELIIINFAANPTPVNRAEIEAWTQTMNNQIKINNG